MSDKEDPGAVVSSMTPVVAGATIPTPLVQTETNPPKIETVEKMPKSTRKYYARFEKLFNDLTHEMEIIARHERKLTKIRDEMGDLLREGKK